MPGVNVSNAGNLNGYRRGYVVLSPYFPGMTGEGEGRRDREIGSSGHRVIGTGKSACATRAWSGISAPGGGGAPHVNHGDWGEAGV